MQQGKDMEKTIDLFLSGNAPAEEKPELHVIIEEQTQNHRSKIDTTSSQIQETKKKEDLKQYFMKEYSDILENQNKNNKFY